MTLIGLLIIAAAVGLDRLTKWLVVNNIGYHDTINIIKIGDTEILNFSYYTNSGAAFSMWDNMTGLITVATAVMSALLLILLLTKKVKRPATVAAISLIAGGGIGNLIDRIFNNGEVVDFIDFRIINFAIFNVADICAVCGAILICLIVVTDDIRESVKKRKEKNGSAENGNDQPD